MTCLRASRILLLTFVLGRALLVQEAAAEVIRLKNGNVVEGTIESRTEQEVRVMIPDMGAMIFKSSEIAAIEASAPAASGKEAPPAAAAASGDAEPVKGGDHLAVFRNPVRAVRMAYPKGWHVREHKDVHPYVLSLKPTPFEAEGAPGAPVVIELFKYYYPSYAVGLKTRGSSQQIIEQFLQVFPKMGGKILAKQTIEVQGTEGVLLEAEGAAPGEAQHHMLVLIAVKNDVMAQLYLQAPPKAFEDYRALFMDVIAAAQPFSNDPKRTDTQMLDQQTERLEAEAIKAFDARDGKTFVQRFQEARQLNPGNAEHAMNFGTRLFMMAGAQGGEEGLQLLQRAEHELRTAVELADCWGGPDIAGPVKGQAYYMLAGIADRLGKKAETKAMLQASQRAYPNPKVQEMLKRYGGP